MALPANAPTNVTPHPSSITSAAIAIRRAEELLRSLPGVVSAKIVASDGGAVDEIHLLTTAEVTPKQTVRNVESALLAHLGMRIDHRKISVATTVEAPKPYEPQAIHAAPRPDEPRRAAAVGVAEQRRLYFEHVDVRRSRTKGVACRVTLRRGEASFVGEAEGPETDRSRVELAARATILAISKAEDDGQQLVFEGCKLLEAFEREFVFVGVTVRVGREQALLAGTCEIREGPETASVLAVLDATNRWLGHRRQ